jgi:predicted protein tyrosine phosphatase
MTKPKLLFICQAGKDRSPTGAQIYKEKGHLTDYCGINYQDNEIELHLKWADIVIVMEEHHRKYIAKQFPKEYMKKKIITLNIPDIYKRDQPKLIELLKKELKNKIVNEL